MHTSKARRSFPSKPNEARALVFRGHPREESFSHALANAWISGAEAGGIAVQTIDVHKLAFEPRLKNAYHEDQPLEADLKHVRDSIADASHLVFAYPTWWAGLPSALKGVVDRVFLPGWAFKSNGGALPSPGLSGRSGRILVTMDAPRWYDVLSHRGSPWRQLSNSTLKFCGVKPVRVSRFYSVGKTSLSAREKMLQRARQAGEQDALALLRRLPASPGQRVLGT